MKSVEAQHVFGDALDKTMILLKSILEVFAL